MLHERWSIFIPVVRPFVSAQMAKSKLHLKRVEKAHDQEELEEDEPGGEEPEEEEQEEDDENDEDEDGEDDEEDEDEEDEVSASGDRHVRGKRGAEDRLRTEQLAYKAELRRTVDRTQKEVAVEFGTFVLPEAAADPIAKALLNGSTPGGFRGARRDRSADVRVCLRP